MFTHLFCERTHTDTGEVVDGESGVARVVQWEEAVKAGSEDRVGQAFFEFGHSHMLGEVLEQNFDEDTAAGGCFFLVQMNQRKYMPADSIIAENMAKEASNVAQSVCFVAMDGLVIFGKCLLKEIGP
jgi:hypothetical protein